MEGTPNGSVYPHGPGGGRDGRNGADGFITFTPPASNQQAAVLRPTGGGRNSSSLARYPAGVRVLKVLQDRQRLLPLQAGSSAGRP